ncbi:MAG TPA: hypothetical protein VGB07_34895, partial [Blastocatellia bacterium]
RLFKRSFCCGSQFPAIDCQKHGADEQKESKEQRLGNSIHNVRSPVRVNPSWFDEFFAFAKTDGLYEPPLTIARGRFPENHPLLKKSG